MDHQLLVQLRRSVESAVKDIRLKGDVARTVIGIPCSSEQENLSELVHTATVGTANRRQGAAPIVCLAGVEKDRAALAQTIRNTARRNIHNVLLHGSLGGRGWSTLALMHVAKRFGANLILVDPNQIPLSDVRDPDEAKAPPHFIERLNEAVEQTKVDLVLAMFSRHPLSHPVASLLAYPLFTGVLGARMRQPMPGTAALSARFVRACVDESRACSSEACLYGIDAWLAAIAQLNGFSIAELYWGPVSVFHPDGRLKPVFRQTAGALFNLLANRENHWCKPAETVSHPLTIGVSSLGKTDALDVDIAGLFQRYKEELEQFDETLFRLLIGDALREKMEGWADGDPMDIDLSSEEWIDTLQRFFIEYRFSKRVHPNDVIDGLFPIFLARFLAMASEVARTALSPAIVDRGIQHMVSWTLVDKDADAFIEKRQCFIQAWKTRRSETTSYLPRLGSWEFIPGVDIVVPLELKRPDGSSIWAYEIYHQILNERRAQFETFASETLGLASYDDSQRVLTGVKRFLDDLEHALVTQGLPGGFESADSALRLTDAAIETFSKQGYLQLTPEAALNIVLKVPPRKLLIYLGVNSTGELLRTVPPKDVLALAAWTDRYDYMARVLDVLQREATPSWFHEDALRSTRLSIPAIDTVDEIRGSAALLRLSGRLAAAGHLRQQRGEWPMLWYLLKTLKRLASFEMYSRIWTELLVEKDAFSARLVASIRGHFGRRLLSAHNLSENAQQRRVAACLRDFAATLDNDPKRQALAKMLTAAADIYPVAITLTDNTFVPLSAWTWCSYSAGGGTDWPSPLSSLVERDHATRDFLVRYLEASGLGDADDTVSHTVTRLVKAGQESEDLGELLLGVTSESEQMLLIQTADDSDKPAGRLVRKVIGPVLSPIRAHSWESRYVLNAAAVWLDNTTYIVYRAFGDDEISRLGLAWTRDGVTIAGRLPTPIFSPADASEKKGCEDPRITVIEDRLYMLYTAYDGKTAQVALTSISVDDFLSKRFDNWRRHGLAFPGLPNKDAVLYPEKFNGKFAVYHRIDPAMWVSYMSALSCPFPRDGHKIVIGPRSGMMWDSIKIGAGAQPIKTTKGWLNIYHGVDYNWVYRLGVLLMDTADPCKIIYQSPNPILEPEVDFELGQTESGEFWVPKVVFTCGAVVRRETAVATMDDEVWVYYGAADTAIGVATARIGDLLPD